jgi:hypothetical protein
MRFASLLNKATQVSQLKKVYFTLAMLALLLFTAIFFLNYHLLKARKINAIEQHTEVLRSMLKESLDTYKEILETISTRLIDPELDDKSISALLKQFYINDNNFNKIPFLDLTWHDEKRNIAINRYGKAEGTLKLPIELKSALKHGTKGLFLASLDDQLSLSGHKQLSILMNAANAHGDHSCYLTALLDIETWIKAQTKHWDGKLQSYQHLQQRTKTVLETVTHTISTQGSEKSVLTDRSEDKSKDTLFLTQLGLSAEPKTFSKTILETGSSAQEEKKKVTKKEKNL